MGQFDTNYIIFRNVGKFEKNIKKLSEINFFPEGKLKNLMEIF
jgi:hypothetical protein